jgi:hypothetical protein
VGRHTHVYATDEDASAFIEFARSTGDIALLPACAPIESFHTFRTGDEAVQFARTSGGVPIYMWNRDISSAPQTSDIAAYARRCVDQLQSEVVQFSPSPHSEAEIGVGRLYVDTYKTVGDEVRRADPRFLDWYALLARWVRRNFRYDKARQTYVSPGADKLVQAGWRLG